MRVVFWWVAFTITTTSLLSCAGDSNAPNIEADPHMSVDSGSSTPTSVSDPSSDRQLDDASSNEDTDSSVDAHVDGSAVASGADAAADTGVPPTMDAGLTTAVSRLRLAALLWSLDELCDGE